MHTGIGRFLIQSLADKTLCIIIETTKVDWSRYRFFYREGKYFNKYSLKKLFVFQVNVEMSGPVLCTFESLPLSWDQRHQVFGEVTKPVFAELVRWLVVLVFALQESLFSLVWSSQYKAGPRDGRCLCSRLQVYQHSRHHCKPRRPFDDFHMFLSVIMYWGTSLKRLQC